MPIVFTSVNVTTVEKSTLKPNVTGIAVIREFKDTLDIALRLQPDTTHVVVPVGTSALEKSWGSETRAALQPFESRVEMTYLTDLSDR